MESVGPRLEAKILLHNSMVMYQLATPTAVLVPRRGKNGDPKPVEYMPLL